MSREQIVEHAGYIRDRAKVDAFAVALERTVRADSIVLDLGTGTGILGLVAVAAGARRVYAIDSGPIVSTARSIADANGLGDRFVFIQESSGRLHLDEPADIIVADQIGGMAYDAGVLEYFADTGSRLLRPGGTLIPSRFRLVAAPVEAPLWPESIGVWTNHPHGFDMSPMFDLAVNTEYRVELDRSAFLGQGAEWSRIASDHVKPIRGAASLTIERPGVLNGVAGTFVAELVPGVEIHNSPLAADPITRWQNFYPVPTPTPVEPGDTVTIEFDVRPTSYITTWSVTVTPRRGLAHGPTRCSTVLGRFLAPTDAAQAAGQVAPPKSDLLDADRSILELVDGQRTMGAIADLVQGRHPDVFRSRTDAWRRVDHLLRRHVQADRARATLAED